MTHVMPRLLKPTPVRVNEMLAELDPRAFTNSAVMSIHMGQNDRQSEVTVHWDAGATRFTQSDITAFLTRVEEACRTRGWMFTFDAPGLRFHIKKA